MKFIAACLFFLIASLATAQQRNVLLIIADDLGIDSLAAFNSNGGAVLPPTPNINSLKVGGTGIPGGVLFRNAFSMPTCSPTRACILTGRHPFRHGVTTAVTANDGQLRASEFTLPRAFAANPVLGYATALFGKWHLTLSNSYANDPNNIGGWPHYSGGLAGALASYTGWTKTINGVSGTTNGTTAYATTDTTDDAVAWIAARGTQPWFACVSYNAPHTPFHKPPNNLHTYDTTQPNWANLPINDTTAHQRVHYDAAIEAMDTEIGRLLLSVDRAKTDIIFVGDNGTPNQVVQTPFATGHAKDTLYEGGTHVPLIIAGPDVVSPNRDSTAMVNVADLYATVLELAGINISATQPATNPLDAKSLLPILKNTTDITRYGYMEQSGSTLTSAESGRAVRNAAGYKLIRYNDAHEEFYYIPSDANEASNLLLGTLNSTQQSNYSELSAQLTVNVAQSNVLNAPLENSWLTYSGAKYARIYRTQAEALAGQSMTTWVTPFGGVSGPGVVTAGTQSSPVYAGVQSLRVSPTWVYMQSSGLPTHVIGPWYFNAQKTQLFLAWPTKQNVLVRFPRLGVKAAVPDATTLGAIAYWVDGTIIHNQLDAFYWNGSADVTNAGVTGSWERNAYYAEGLTFDPDNAHQPSTGEHHHHISPSGLRFVLGDHMNYNAATHTYSENPALPGHSPIVGWSFDGFPIYGPYGYSDANDAASTVRRMTSGYVMRDGSFGTTNLNVTGRTSYPKWATDMPTQLTNLNGPSVSTNYPLGWYVQDFDHKADHGYTQGVDFDLDRYNGRLCKTPEFPNGTYAYFIAIEADGTPAYPYIIGRQYYGVKQGGNYGGAATVGFSGVEAPAATVYQGGASAAFALGSPMYSPVSGGQITLQWSSVEGGHYTIQSSTNLTTWGTSQANLPGSSTGISQSTLPASGQRGFFRASLDAVDASDAVSTP